MMKRKITAITLAAVMAMPSLGYAQGGLNMDREEMLGSVIGASVGALLGSKVGDGDNELLGAALGGVGGYFVGKRYGDRNPWRDDGRYGEQRHYGYDRYDDDRRYRDHGSHRRHHGHARGQHRAYDRTPPIHAIDQPFRARVNSHVRSGPAPGYQSLDVLRRGERVHVVGRVSGTDWFMVSRRGRVAGYVYAPLLDPDNRHSYYRRDR